MHNIDSITVYKINLLFVPPMMIIDINDLHGVQTKYM